MKIMHNRQGSRRGRFYAELMNTEEFVAEIKETMMLQRPSEYQKRRRRA